MWVLAHVHFLLVAEVKVDRAAVDGSPCLLAVVVEEEVVVAEEEVAVEVVEAVEAVAADKVAAAVAVAVSSLMALMLQM